MGLLGWIVVGLVAGSVAQRLTGAQRRGCLFTMVLGVIGAVIGGALFNAAGSHGIGDFGLWSMFVALVGAVLVVLLMQALTRGR